MNTTLTMALVLSLVDRWSAPLAGVTERIAGLGARLTRIGAGITMAAGALDQLTGAGPLAFMQRAIDVEHRLAALGNTAGLSGAQLHEIDRRLSSAARATNQFKGELLAANETLMAAGLDWQSALDLTPIIGRTATATQAAITDLAKVAESARTNLQIPVAAMQQAMDRLTVAGESGKFELKDMARFLPSLTAAMATLKFTGMENLSRLGAALQIAFRGAGEPGEAANNVLNFLNKLAAPETLRNFEKMGVDLEATLRRARTQGLDPFVTVLQEIDRATKGNEFKLGELFADQQVLAFIKPMLQYLRDYQGMLEQIGRGDGKVAENFARMMTTTAERWKQFQIQMQTSDLPWLTTWINRASEALKWMNANTAQTERLTTALAVLTGAGLGLAVLAPVVRALGAALLWIATPAATVVAALGTIGLSAAMLFGQWNPIADYWPQVWDRIVEEVGGRIARLVKMIDDFKAKLPSLDLQLPHLTTPAEAAKDADPAGYPKSSYPLKRRVLEFFGIDQPEEAPAAEPKPQLAPAPAPPPTPAPPPKPAPKPAPKPSPPPAPVVTTTALDAQAEALRRSYEAAGLSADEAARRVADFRRRASAPPPANATPGGTSGDAQAEALRKSYEATGLSAEEAARKIEEFRRRAAQAGDGAQPGGGAQPVGWAEGRSPTDAAATRAAFDAAFKAPIPITFDTAAAVAAAVSQLRAAFAAQQFVVPVTLAVTQTTATASGTGAPAADVGKAANQTGTFQG